MIKRPPGKQSLVALAQQVGVEVVHVAALLAADVALPGVGLAVAALVQEVQRGVGERDGAERAHERRRRQRRLAVRRRDHAALRRRSAGLQRGTGHGTLATTTTDYHQYTTYIIIHSLYPSPVSASDVHQLQTDRNLTKAETRLRIAALVGHLILTRNNHK